MSQSNNHSSDKQARRRERGEQFQQEIRNSWTLIPNSWRLHIADGRGATRPADELVILDDCNLLLELKRTVKPGFDLNVMRKNQIKGLLDFERVGKRNRGIVLLSIVNDEHDQVIAFRLSKALEYMRSKNRTHIKYEEFFKGELQFLFVFLHEDYAHLPEGERIYDLERLVTKWESL